MRSLKRSTRFTERDSGLLRRSATHSAEQATPEMAAQVLERVLALALGSGHSPVFIRLSSSLLGRRKD